MTSHPHVGSIPTTSDRIRFTRLIGGKVIETGWYIVENQHHQTGNAYWNGEKWTNVSFVKGSCMKYSDEKIVSWKPVKPNENIIKYYQNLFFENYKEESNSEKKASLEFEINYLLIDFVRKFAEVKKLEEISVKDVQEFTSNWMKERFK